MSLSRQMAVMLHYMNKSGCVVEHFVGVEHVISTTTLSLKDAIDRLFSKYWLSISRLQRQGYDRVSNMQG